MGYNTKYNLKWMAMPGFVNEPSCGHEPDKGNKFCPECGVPVGAKNLDKQIGDCIDRWSEMRFAINRSGDSNETCSWYTHESDVAAVSATYPKVLFVLNGEGEESGDIWRKYFLNGKIQREKAKVQIDNFNPKKLTDV